MFSGDCTASDGTLTICFAANVAGSYSAISPGARSSHNRFSCPIEAEMSNKSAHANCDANFMNSSDFLTASRPSAIQ